MYYVVGGDASFAPQANLVSIQIITGCFENIFGLIAPWGFIHSISFLYILINFDLLLELLDQLQNVI